MFLTSFTGLSIQGQNNLSAAQELTFLNFLWNKGTFSCGKPLLFVLDWKTEGVFDLLKRPAINLVQHIGRGSAVEIV